MRTYAYSVLLTLIALLLVLLDESVEINHDVLWFTLCEQEREWPSHSTIYIVHVYDIYMSHT